MKKTGAWLVRYALEQIGARHTFGIPGVHTTEIYDELNNSNQIKPMLVTHEAGASFMADAISRTSDSVGVCVVVPAAGLTHAMSGIGEAYLDGIPMIVISGGTRTDTGHEYQLHQMDQQALMAPLTKGTFRAETQDEIVPKIFEAYDLSISGEPGPVYVEIPVNLQLLKGEVSALPEYSKLERLGAAVDKSSIEAAAEKLAQAKKPGIFLGWGAKTARETIMEISEQLNAPVCSSLQGLGVYPHSHKNWAGMGFGPAAVPAARDAFEDCDVMLAIGVRFGEIATGSFSSIPPEDLIHIDINPDAIGANYPATIGIEGDSAEAAPLLLAALKDKKITNQTSPSATIHAGREKYRAAWAKHDSKDRVNPQVFFDALDTHLQKDGMVVVDDGNHTFLTAELMPIRDERRFISPTDFNCMGYCVPATNAAKLENREKQVVGIVGDGAFLMTGMEALTATANGLGVVYFIFADGELSQIAQAQEIPYNRKTCTVLPELNHEGMALAVHAGYVAIDCNDDCDKGILKALEIAAGDRPVLVRVNIDYSKRTAFTEGAVKANIDRFDTMTKLRMVGRAVGRKITG
ncbi:thiamine pyrophosphate-binding protein [Temperatibacter marinus]|uniref:Thiamine pyrophosphate-binding protein n=1 Tax=Temperatibacter marinus TaxID=1456591 RepID=A0AA52ECK5_9PROT|nr:thiamine pyrophosphate-binding protein [Temperatibacter marinus]WND02927.1 thiamine pyrophosphate-binding protein [Temperatibacter marinus]